jgi:hypothetical protein
MVDDRPEDTPPLPDSGRPKRAPPTIDLKATEVSGPIDSTAEAKPEPKSEFKSESRFESTSEPKPESESKSGFKPEPESEPTPEVTSQPTAAAAPVSPWIVAALSGAVAASLVIGVGWMLGWPPVQPATPAAQVNAATIDGLTARIASVESSTSKPAASDPAAAARVEALEKSIVALRGELAAARPQSDKVATAVNDLKSTPGASSPSADLSAIEERIAQVERLSRAQSAEIAKDSARPADDASLRRVVVASMLDVAVRQGESFAPALAAAKSLTDNAETLKPLDGFAASGVPSAATLSRELLTLVPKLSPPAPENATTGSGIVERLQAGASKLVRIERTDAVGSDRGAIVARVTAAALRNDSNEARRELKTLEPADRAAAQAWLDKADARDAALTAARQFADNAMAALARPQQ